MLRVVSTGDKTHCYCYRGIRRVEKYCQMEVRCTDVSLYLPSRGGDCVLPGFSVPTLPVFNTLYRVICFKLIYALASFEWEYQNIIIYYYYYNKLCSNISACTEHTFKVNMMWSVALKITFNNNSGYQFPSNHLALAILNIGRNRKLPMILT